MCDAKIVKLYKNKVDRSNCKNYRCISLLGIVVLAQLQILATNVYPETQCGVRACRSAKDMIFSLLKLQEKCREKQNDLFIAFINLTKAFYLVSGAINVVYLFSFVSFLN